MRPNYKCCLQEYHFENEESRMLKSKKVKLYHANANKKKTGIALLTSGKSDLR